MALAKFFEDLVEDTLDGQRWLFDTGERRDPAREWQAAKQQESAAVRLLHRGGFAWDDRESFNADEPIVAMVETNRPDLPVKVTWRSSRGVSPKIETVRGGVKISATQVNSGDLHVDCGHYRKTYRVSFTKALQLESLPDFSAKLAALTHNPVYWSQSAFDAFRIGVESLLQAHELPEDYCYGIREFYLGLYHEQIREARFGDRLDRAAMLLRPFIGQSRLAISICGYQMYRINEFEHPLAGFALKRIGRASRFFATGTFSSEEAPMEKSKGEKTQMLISAADHAMLDAIAAMDRGDTMEFRKHADVVSRSLSPHDPQGLERFDYLRAQVCKATGDSRQAKAYAANLAHSIIPSFRALAQQTH
jgi:hypothetical protein